MRGILIWGTLLLGLGTVNGLVLAKERVLQEGISVLLPLRGEPEDARGRLCRDDLPRGPLVIALDGSGVVQYRRRFAGEELRSDECLLRCRDGDLWPSGPGALFSAANAHFVEMRVDRDGRNVVVRLRDEELRPL